MGSWAFRPRHLCGGILPVALALALGGVMHAGDSQKPGDKAASLAAAAPAFTPLDLVQSSLSRSRAILLASRTPVSDLDDRRRELRRVSHELFAFDAMARRALGPQWTALSAPNQQKFLSLFTDMVERVYGIAVEQYARDQVVFLGEKVAPPHAEVRSRLIARGMTISIDYRMLEEQSRWAVYDAIIDNISVVANYRSQFESIIRTSSFDELLDRMQRFTRPQPRRPGEDTERDDQKVLVLAYLLSSASTRR
jgi:phospholipid transport system substrate-binding protein